MMKANASRHWLNDDKAQTGSISYSFEPAESVSKCAGRMYFHPYAELTLVVQDCERKVTLDFSFSAVDEKDIRKRIKKATLIRDYADALVSTLTGALEEVPEMKAAAAEVKAARKKHEEYV
jgi:hypothetical protein